MVEAIRQEGTQPGFYFSRKLNLMLELVQAGRSLPVTDDWEFIGSDIALTPSEALRKVMEIHPDLDATKLTFSAK
ncbi:MAG: hypothetical protein M1343_02005 [Chloroflexi bacterium]|nr:hypothetical protein [Chloroflexota bacterium]MDA8188746.1 hypothetical protein [Dehalococcoidales bacterium]